MIMELPKMKDNDNLLRKHHCFQVRPPTPSSAKVELAVDLGWGQVPWCSDSGPFFFFFFFFLLAAMPRQRSGSWEDTTLAKTILYSEGSEINCLL